jgi:hypothetical protein
MNACRILEANDSEPIVATATVLATEEATLHEMNHINVCVCIYIYIDIYVHIHTHTYIHTHILYVPPDLLFQRCVEFLPLFFQS